VFIVTVGKTALARLVEAPSDSVCVQQPLVVVPACNEKFLEFITPRQAGGAERSCGGGNETFKLSLPGVVLEPTALRETGGVRGTPPLGSRDEVELGDLEFGHAGFETPVLALCANVQTRVSVFRGRCAPRDLDAIGSICQGPSAIARVSSRKPFSHGNLCQSTLVSLKAGLGYSALPQEVASLSLSFIHKFSLLRPPSIFLSVAHSCCCGTLAPKGITSSPVTTGLLTCRTRDGVYIRPW
jgi:hypothetical protein